MKVLMISYYFPPLGMGGTQRPAKFAKYLHEFGWEPVVLTVKPIAYFAQDDSMLKELGHVRIIRTGSLDPQRLMARIGKCQAGGGTGGSKWAAWINEYLLSFVLRPDSKRLWHWHALRTARRLLKQERFDAIYTTSPPHSVQLLGLTLKKQFGIKWIADFRDAWAGGVVVHEPTAWQYHDNRRMQKKVLQYADAVLCVTPGLARDLTPMAGDTPVHVLTNGYDPEDYPESQRTDSRFVICHCGSVTRFSHPEIFLSACAQLKHKDPGLAKKLQIQFVGYDALGVLPNLVKKYHVDDLVQMIGYQPHWKALEYLVSADALLLIALGRPGDRFVPGKVFEYIGAQKSIIAVTNVDDTKTILNQYSGTVLTRPRASEIVGAVHQLMQNGGEQHTQAELESERFERRHQTGILTEIMEKEKPDS